MIFPSTITGTHRIRICVWGSRGKAASLLRPWEKNAQITINTWKWYRPIWEQQLKLERKFYRIQFWVSARGPWQNLTVLYLPGPDVLLKLTNQASFQDKTLHWTNLAGSKIQIDWNRDNWAKKIEGSDKNGRKMITEPFFFFLNHYEKTIEETALELSWWNILPSQKYSKIHFV